jgi:hypothetical protein
MKKIVKPYFIFIALIMVSCSSGGSDDGPTPIPDPTAAILIFPEKDKECTQGTVINNTESDLTFEWNAASNADSYEVNLRNLNTNTSKKINSTTNSVTITVLRGTPYEWYVVSKANGTTVTASSDKWKFYNEGPGIENYAPFPADVVAPKRGAQVENTGTVSLEWTGSDVDNDIDEYEVFFGTVNPPTNSLVTTTSTTTNTSVNANTVYYWYVVTTDVAGNTSTSETFEFKVKN